MEMNRISTKANPNRYIEHDEFYELDIHSPTYGIFNCKIDKEDYDKVKNYIWCISKAWNKETNKKPRFYVSCSNVNDTKKQILMHRWLMDAPKGKVVDHINHNEQDNRKSNLRVCYQYENSSNCKKYISNTSGYKGVTWIEKHQKWMAYLMIRQKFKNLGYFTDIEDAHKARLKGEEKYFGEFSPDE
jgi:hypothetical protein